MIYDQIFCSRAVLRNLFLRYTKTMSKFSQHTSAKMRRKFTHQITVTTPTLSAVQWDAWGCRNKLNHCMLGSIFEMATRSSRSISFKHDRLSFLINTNIEKLCSHKYVVQNWRRISRAFSEICLHSFPTAIQNSSRGISLNFNRVFCHFVVQESFL